ncbi:MAG: hypothetical protein ACI8P3_003389 [Saprospiraceae bacterium]
MAKHKFMSIQITKNHKTAILFGASGLVGRHCLDFLLASSTYDKVLVFVRRKLKIEHDKLVQQVIDFDKLETYENLIAGDDLFCCLGTTMKKAGSKEAFKRVDYTYTHQIAEIGAKNKVNQFLLVSSVGADKDSLFFYNQVKGELEAEVKLMPYWAVYIFQPSLLLGDRNENRWGESIAQRIGGLLDKVTGGLLQKYQPVEADVVAKAMVSAAQQVEKGVHVYPSHVLQKLSRIENDKIDSRRDDFPKDTTY